jgi:beta-glucanase (GH16 family)
VTDLAGYTLAWSDEFDGPAGSPPDPSAWRPQTGGHGWGNAELQYYTGGTENACLDGDGHLAITVRRLEPGVRHRYGGCEYSSARLTSKDHVTLRYGAVQARMRLPGGRGIWPAFWMLGQDIDQVGWPRCGEIDVMENFGRDPALVHGAVHGPGYTGGAGISANHRAAASLADGFHVYSVAWEPGRIRWYLDGRPWAFDHDFFLLLNVAVGGTAAPVPDGSVSFPRQMLVDYVRVYTASVDLSDTVI